MYGIKANPMISRCTHVYLVVTWTFNVVKNGNSLLKNKASREKVFVNQLYFTRTFIYIWMCAYT